MGPPDSPDLTCPFANATVSFCFTKLRVVPNQSFAVLAFGDAQTSLLGKQASRCGVCARRTQGNCPGFDYRAAFSLSTALPGISAFRNADFFLLRSSKRERTLGDSPDVDASGCTRHLLRIKTTRETLALRHARIKRDGEHIRPALRVKRNFQFLIGISGERNGTTEQLCQAASGMLVRFLSLDWRWMSSLRMAATMAHL